MLIVTDLGLTVDSTSIAHSTTTAMFQVQVQTGLLLSFVF